MKIAILLISLFTTIVFPAKASAASYDWKCLSNSRWKKVKQYQFFIEGQKYQLIQSFEKANAKQPLVALSLCLAKGNLVKPFNITLSSNGNSFDFNGYYKLNNSSDLKKVGATTFEIRVYAEDPAGGSTTRKYRIDFKNPDKPKAKILSQIIG
jgi:hypothetical protein